MTPSFGVKAQVSFASSQVSVVQERPSLHVDIVTQALRKNGRITEAEVVVVARSKSSRSSTLNE